MGCEENQLVEVEHDDDDGDGDVLRIKRDKASRTQQEEYWKKALNVDRPVHEILASSVACYHNIFVLFFPSSSIFGLSFA
ncbi:hypothetical protein RIF29_41620 [Crotalaria pallida]|uniref:Uncharacterized protein n=1 Tax=Crotalaria pallida TaxID=3830 RepID=A0AAN9HPJ6_CROPI